MRTIKFRGMTKDKKWVYGYYSEKCVDKWDNLQTVIYDIDSLFDYEVLPETVGQFTGLEDKNSKEIYHKDIAKDFCGILWLVEERGYKWVVIRLPWDRENEPPDKYDLCDMEYLEVVGNVHENPELLGEQK